jgi:hypothetical protein
LFFLNESRQGCFFLNESKQGCLFWNVSRQGCLVVRRRGTTNKIVVAKGKKRRYVLKTNGWNENKQGVTNVYFGMRVSTRMF